MAVRPGPVSETRLTLRKGNGQRVEPTGLGRVATCRPWRGLCCSLRDCGDSGSCFVRGLFPPQ